MFSTNFSATNALVVFHSYIGKWTVLKKEISVQYLTDLPKRCLLSTFLCGHISCLLMHEISGSLSLWFSRYHCLFFTVFSVNSFSCLKLRSLAERELQNFFAEVQCLVLVLFLLLCFFFFVEKFTEFFMFRSANV